MSDMEQSVSSGSRGALNVEPTQPQQSSQSSDQLQGAADTNTAPPVEQPNHDFSAIPDSAAQQPQDLQSQGNYTITSTASNPSLIQRGSRMNIGSNPNSRQGSKSDLVALDAATNGQAQSQTVADQPASEPQQQSSPKRSYLSVDNISSSSNNVVGTNQQQQSQQVAQSSGSRRSSRRASAADAMSASTHASQNQIAPEPTSRRSLLGSISKTGSALSLTVGGDMRVLENMYNADSAFNESNVLMRSPSGGSRPRLVGSKSKSMQSLLQGAKEAFEKVVKLENDHAEQQRRQHNQEDDAQRRPTTSVPSVLVSFGDSLDQRYELKADRVGSEQSLLERARNIALPVSRAGSLVNLEFAGTAPFLTFDRVPSVPRITHGDDNQDSDRPQAFNSRSILEAAVHSPLPVSRSPSFSAPCTSDLEANIEAVYINTSRLINTELVADAQPVEPEPTPIVYPVDRPVLAPFQVTQQVSAQKRDMSFIENLTHEQLIQLAKVQYQQIQELHSIREQEVEFLSRSLSQARAENISLRSKILQLSQQQPGSRSMSKQSSFADLPSTLQQALSCDSVDDAINLIKNEPLAATTVPAAEVQPLQLHDTLINTKVQSRHGSKPELAKKYGSGMVSVRSTRKGDKANDSAMDIEKIRLKEDLTATTMENERLLEYLHLLINRIMEVPEAIKVLASPIGGTKPVMGKS